ncbi:MAG: hypothetical protein ABI325_03285 [Ginsengibacter sp.]
MAILAGFFFHSCCSIWGAHDLGNKLILLEGDKTEDRAIVYCTTQKGCCRGGMYVIPSVGNQYHMYVETAKSNRNWVIAKTVQIKDKKENYWIINKNFDITNLNCDKINCDSIIQSHIIGPLNFIDFEKKVKGLNIDLSLK